MPKKTIYWLCGVLVLLALGFYGFSKWTEAREKVSLWTLVPDDAVFVVETNNAPRFLDHLQETDLWTTVSQMPFVLRLDDQLALVDSLSTGRSSLRNFLTKKNVLVSMHVLGRSEFEMIYYVPVSTVGQHRYIRTLMENLRKIGEYRQESREYQGFQITDIIHKSNNSNLSYFSFHNNLIISPSPVLVEETIRKINRGQLESPAKEYKNTNYLSQNDVYANVFINYQHVPDLLGVFLKKDLRDDINLLSSLCKNSMLELKLDNNRLFLNGFSHPETVEGSLYSRIKGHPAKTFNLREIIPQRAAVVLHMGLNQMSTLRKEPGPVGGSFLDSLSSSFAGELGLCYLEAYDTKTSAEKILFAQTTNPLVTQQMLNRLQPGQTAGTQEKHGKNIIRLLTARELPQQLFGEIFKGFEQTYYTTLGNYILFTDDVATMRSLLTEVEAGKVWSKSAALEPKLNESQQEDNLGIFINTSNAWNLLLRSMNPQKQGSLLSNSSIVKKFNFFSVQFSAKESQYYTSIILRHQEESTVKTVIARQGIRREETFDFKNRLISPPFLTHYPVDNSEELVVQDSSLVLYGIGAAQGRRNWTDSLNARVVGPVHQLPYGGDKRLKYFFATTNGIHCIDKNGTEQENFPFSLGDSLRLQRLTVFDYDKTGDYHLVADDNLGNVFILDMQGNMLPGWSPMRLDGRLAAPPQHVKVNGRNVLLMVLENGYVHAFGAQGEPYPGFPINLNTNLRSGLFPKLGISFRRSLFTTVTQNGEIITFDLTGEVTKREQLLRPDRRSTFKLVPEAGGKSFIIARSDPGRVALFGQDGKLLLDRRFVTSSPKEVQYFHFGGDRKLYVIWETGPRKAYLFDVHAQPLGQDPINTGFPVEVRFNEVQNQYSVFSTYNKALKKTIVQGRN
ncbi:hypothetical protein [Rufibacter tibetensis]|uniref:DUF3352 domain-containing protein n=1 Tax=Rufibacter tibetensis TaxID=512763 RepID=A0A0P0C057_9BACT|nr:hypothetical protein [Rufibacter tibetensis]ALI98183.1 hypothetical protein DC20_03305 [Rufibacter tibetensis]